MFATLSHFITMKCCFVLFLLFARSLGLKECGQKDFIYAYTECQEGKPQWRVQVPEDKDKCEKGTPKPATLTAGCGTKCSGGTFMDIAKLQCISCPAGTYSVGSGIRIDYWDTIPKGFSHSAVYPEYYRIGNSVNCTGKGWQPNGDFISFDGGPCTAMLTYSVILERPGSIDFEYENPDEAIMFTFEVRNDHCQLTNNESADPFLSPTDQAKFTKKTVKLKAGRNLLTWEAFVLDPENVHSQVKIRSVVIDGMSFLSECPKCRPGYASSKGATLCSPCGANKYADKRGATECLPCNANQYSGRGSDKCIDKPACTKYDYYDYYETCNDQNQTQHKFAWREPHVCRDDLPNAIKLPANGQPENCLPCNAGTEWSNSSKCSFCPVNMMSSGLGPCQACPPNTEPINELRYNRWSVIPPNMTFKCIAMEAKKCDTKWGVTLAKDHVRLGGGYEGDIFSFVHLDAGRLGKGLDSASGHKGIPPGGNVARISFDFKVQCSGKCRLYFVVKGENLNTRDIVSKWIGTHGRQKYSYYINNENATGFVWAFDKYGGEVKTAESHENHAAIYAINVTNVRDAGAVACERCPLGIVKDSCVQCPSGQYFEEKLAICNSCPDNGIVWRVPARSVKDCRKCGPGLVPVNGIACVMQPRMVTVNNRSQDFTKILGMHNITGLRLFATGGTKYYHVFNFTLDNRDPTKLASCVNNFTASETGGKLGVHSLICRFTMLPKRGKKGLYLSGQPISLADELVNVTNSNFSKAHWDEMNKKLVTAGWDKDEDGYDVHFQYVSTRITTACPQGRASLITLRCAVKGKHEEGHIELPPNCPDGTCDGCTFHFLWTTRNACPICRTDDYDVISGECVMGQRTLHYIPHKHCYFTGSAGKKKTEVVNCPLVSKPAGIAIIVAVIIGIVLIGSLFYCYKSNKKLQYKYMKLVEGQGGRDDAELPGVESCAVNEGEEEEDDDIQIRGHGSSRAFFSRIKNLTKPGHHYSGDNMESVNLTEKMDYTL